MFSTSCITVRYVTCNHASVAWVHLKSASMIFQFNVYYQRHEVERQNHTHIIRFYELEIPPSQQSERNTWYTYFCINEDIVISRITVIVVDIKKKSRNETTTYMMLRLILMINQTSIGEKYLFYQNHLNRKLKHWENSEY